MNIIRLPNRFCWPLLTVWLLCCQEMVADNLLKTEYSYQHYTTHDGLTDMVCDDLYQDSKGYIWIGTLNGFARYDGQYFKTFLQDADEAALGFSENAEGDIFGISLRWQHQVHSESDLVYTRRIVSSTDKYEYVISKSMPMGYGVFKIDNLWAIYTLADTILTKVWHHEALNKLSDGQKPYWDRNGKQFLIPTLEGTYIIGEDGIVKDSFAINTINCFVPHKGGFWAVADDGLYEYNNHKLRRVLEYPFYAGNNRDYSILEDPNKDLLIRAENTIFRYAGDKLETIADNLPQTNDMTIDREGNLWVATTRGVYNFYRLNFKSHNLFPRENYIMSVLIDSQNRVWLSSIQGDIVCINNGMEEKINYPVSPYKETFFGMGSVIDGDDLYFTGGASVLHYNIGQKKFNWLNLPEDGYYHIAPLSNGNMAIGSFEDTYIYASENGVIRKYEFADIKQTILDVVENKQGQLLLGGVEGVVIIDGDSIRHIFDEKIEMCRNMIYDPAGKLWLTCKNNLIIMDEEKFTVVHAFPALIRNIYFTNNNVMIVATSDAIYLSKNIGNNPEFVRYDQYNGFNSFNIVETTPMAEDEKGNVWLLTYDGAIQFKPEELLRKQPVPSLYMQTIQSSTDNIGWENVDRESSELGYKDNNIRLNYVALCFSSAGNIRYQYRLIGFQNEWSKPTSDRQVTFNNLPPGQYEFQIKADAGAGGTETGIVSQHFTIHPAFWQTVWFQALAIGLLIALITLIISRYMRAKHAKEMLKAKREKEMNELRVQSIRLKSIPHFNSNVLAGIEYQILTNNKKDANRLLSTYSIFTNQTLHEIDKAQRSLKSEVDYTRLYLELEKMRYGEKLFYKIEVDEQVDSSVMIPNMVMHTYTENAIKHGICGKKERGEVVIEVINKDRGILVSVEDDGIGREASRKRNPERQGFGLSILTRQIELYNQQNKEKIEQTIVDLTDKNGMPCGTRFELYVPYSYEYL